MSDLPIQAKILVVDDEQKAQTNLKRFLENKNFEVNIAYNGNEALERLEDFKPQCILLDIRMPYLNGIDTLKMIKDRQPSVEVIMVTGVTNLKIAEGCLRDGAFAVIEKPVNFEYLYRKILQALQPGNKA
ncbi:MAG: response regulator [Nitrospinaceae bacterium]